MGCNAICYKLMLNLWSKICMIVMENLRQENKIDLKPVKALGGMIFFIPKYQRGYRWTTQQVTDLLMDIQEFQSKKKGPSEFYCLQPLVVKRRDCDILAKIKEAETLEAVEQLLSGSSWEVIDGQQRLTTIYVILSVLGYQEFYQLEYETQPNFRDFLKALMLAGDIDYQKFIEQKPDYDNINYYHVFNAYKTIKKWIETNNVDTENFLKTLVENVNFIWYESVDENPIEVFTRLNIGKIPLTNAELIKALHLNSSNFNVRDAVGLRLCQQEIASEWDRIEYTLQDEEFWLFLQDEGDAKHTRIDFIFDLIVKKNPLLSVDELSDLGDDEYRTFRYFNKYFSKPENKNEKGVKYCWDIVKKYFLTFMEWFSDSQMYHYVGYLRTDDLSVPLETILDKWNSVKEGHNKEKFIDELKDLIRGKIKDHADLYETYEVEPDDEGIGKGVTKTACRKILLLHNVQTVVQQSNINKEKYSQAVFYRFPFHLYKKEGWHVEHIDSNTENDLSDKDTRNEFLLNIYHSVDNAVKAKIETFIKDPEASNWSDFEEYTKDFDDSLNQIEKNQVWNFTLLDSSTNQSYGNAIVSAKRRIIVGKDQGKRIPIPTLKKIKDGTFDSINDEKAADSPFIPPCTKHIFLKYYTNVSTDYNYWTKSDAIAYETNVIETLREIGVKSSRRLK